MKIGLFSPYDMFKGGGVQEHVVATQAELRRRGHDAIILTPQPRSYKGEIPEHMLFVGGSADFKSPLHTVVQVSVTGSVEKIDEILSREQFDVLHIHEPWIPIVSRQLLSRSQSVNIGTFHARLPDTRVSKTIERVIKPYTKSILKYIDFFTAVSDPAAQYLRHLADVDVNMITNGIDLAKYRPDPAAAFDRPTIFYVGRLEKRKGVKYLIKAFKILQERMPEAQLLIAGAGPDGLTVLGGKGLGRVAAHVDRHDRLDDARCRVADHAVEVEGCRGHHDIPCRQRCSASRRSRNRVTASSVSSSRRVATSPTVRP